MIKELYDKRNSMYGPAVCEALKKRKFEAYYCATKEEALEKAMSLIPKEHVVGWGGSVSINEIGLVDELKKCGYTLLDRDAEPDFAKKAQIMRRIIAEADTFITSSNAITEDGQLLNVDGTGNRVAAITYGPSNVVVIAGINKVVRDIEDARDRIRTIAAPINIQRFPLNTPCKATGKCAECLSDDCICAHWVQTRICKPANRIKVILVGEELGF